MSRSCWRFDVSKFVFCTLTMLFAGAALAETELAIVVAVPHSIETTDRVFDVCGDDPCFAHGYTVIRVDLEVTSVLLGAIDKGRMTVEATNGYLRHNNRPSGDNRHLFVLRKVPEEADRSEMYFVAEADPILGQACTVFPIEDYLSDALWLSVETPFFPPEHCYTVGQIRQLIADQSD